MRRVSHEAPAHGRTKFGRMHIEFAMTHARTVETVQDLERDPQIVWIGEDVKGALAEVVPRLGRADVGG